MSLTVKPSDDIPMVGTPGAGDGIVVRRAVNAPPQVVWEVLADGWMYGMWVVGASRIRQVEPGWPGVGSRIHHSVGLWPALIDDHTEVLESTVNRELLLKARGWPAGEARVRLTLEPGRANHTTITIEEDVTAGPGRLLPRPARQVLITPRNTETLQRLALIAEGRHRARLDNDAAAQAARRRFDPAAGSPLRQPPPGRPGQPSARPAGATG